jgi:2-methylfumaryl-CoA isomerase
MTNAALSGLRIVEGSAFVAAPLGGMILAQLGADVIRFDPIGGGLDYGRWPLASSGHSLFWAGLNKGKRSIRIDIRSAEGLELIARLATRDGPDAGIFLTNLPARGPLAYAALQTRRADVIMVRLIGNCDGTSEVDYTVNAAMGYPLITGPRGSGRPVNSVLPAWDIALGGMAAVGILAAERLRSRQGKGSLVKLALSDVALSVTSALGRLNEAELGGAPAPDGNHLFGALGHDFTTRDGRRVMVVGLTARQWTSLTQATGLDVAGLTRQTHQDLETEGGRFRARDAIVAELAPWFAVRSFVEVKSALDAAGAAWGPYQSFAQLLAEDSRASMANPMFSRIGQPGIGEVLAATPPLDISSAERLAAVPAPRLGQHTDEILSELGLSSSEIGALHDRHIVAGPETD